MPFASPPVDPAVLQEQAFRGATVIVREVERYRQQCLRRIPPVREEVQKASRSLNKVLRSSRDAQQILRGIVQGDGEILIRLFTNRAAFEELQREARATLRLLQTGQTFAGHIDLLSRYLDRSHLYAQRINVPTAVASCGDYAKLVRNHPRLEASLRANHSLLRSANQAASDFWGMRGQVMTDLTQAISLTRKFWLLARVIYDRRVPLLIGMRVVGYGAWGWRLVGMKKKHWKKKSRGEKDQAFYTWARELKASGTQAYEGAVDGQAELARSIDSLPQIQSDIAALAQKSRDALRQLNETPLPPVCSSAGPGVSYSGISPSSFTPSPAALLIGGLVLGVGAALVVTDKGR